jgi:endogenous inhibitor of DNA gyrase (YacG/DUF329 family)
MTPKEKALELYWKYYNRIEHTLSEEYSKHETFLCKQCALIALDEILNDNWYIATYEDLINRKAYWEEVKQEIEKL